MILIYHFRGTIMRILRTETGMIRSILDITQSLIQNCGSRIAGTAGSQKAAHEIAQIMTGFCDKVSEETFYLYPGSLFNIGRIISLVYVLSIPLLYIGDVCAYISLLVCIAAFVYAFVHYFLYGKLFDKFFKKKTGVNAVGVIEPSGDVKRQVIVSGHHDSPYIFNFLSRFEKLAGIRFLFAMLFFIYITMLAIIAVTSQLLMDHVWRLQGAALIAAIAGLIFIIPLFFFISAKASPGAGDNLNGSSIAVHIGRYFADRKKEGAALKNTRLIILSADGEEAGQRGARAYAARHKDELISIPTTVLNFDSIYNMKNLAVLLRDRHGFQPLSSKLADRCQDIAAELGYHLKTINAPFGSGTDAAAFAENGVAATTIIGMPASLFASEYIYHTSKDTVENIEPEAVEAAFNIVANYIADSDQ